MTQPTRQTQRKTQDALPPRTVGDRAPFLKTTDLRAGSTVECLMGTVRSLKGQYGVQILIDVTLDKRDTFTWGIGATAPNLRYLIGHLINGDRAISLEVLKTREGKDYIGVERPANDPRRDD